MKNQEQKLPPLPYTYHAADAEGDVLLFTEEQIRDYAFAAVELAQSQAAPAAPQEWKDELLDRIHLYGRACRRDGNPAWESVEGMALKAHIETLTSQPSAAQPASAQPVEQASFDASDAIERVQDACDWLEELSATNKEAGGYLKRLQSALRILQSASQPSLISYARDAALEEAAKLIEANQCTTTTREYTTEHHLTPRMRGNLLGIAYAEAIRAIKSAPAATEAGER